VKPLKSPKRTRTSSSGRHATIGGLGTAAALALVLTGSPPVLADAESPETTAVVTAPVVHLTFTRSNVTTVAAPTPDEKLRLAVAASGLRPDPAAIKATLAAPLTVLTRTSPFGERFSPIHGAGEFHRGQDFSRPCGTDVLASAGGKVVFAGWHPYGGGNRVEIEHADGLKTTYNHLQASSVRVGQQISRGDAIARVGTTGSSTGCHLHFEVYLHEDVVDPLGWL
jgi:murein DD-endopeptidase MepM/ murein hydrolase activator NlpD